LGIVPNMTDREECVRDNKCIQRNYWESVQRLCRKAAPTLVALGIAILSSTPAHALPSFCSRGYVALLEYVPFGKLGSFAAPWLNLRVGVQYTAYQRFNGGGANYDGFGRSASDNNTLFGFFWFAI
jgi:hypothetical protein